MDLMNWNRLITNKRYGLEERYDTVKEDRTQFQRDYDRLIFSAPFRRMQNKTQVFPLPGSVFVHNRLTHSLEVSSVGRSLGIDTGQVLMKRHPELDASFATSLGAIVSAACLAHDLGNPPFGHAGEKAISSFFSEGEGRRLQDYVVPATGERLTPSQWNDITRFDGNANAFRILTHQFHGRRRGGFVMTYPTLAAIVKYPFSSSFSTKNKFGFFESERDAYKKIADEMGLFCLENRDGLIKYVRHPLAYLVEAADDICYEIMDIEDAYKLRLLTFDETRDPLYRYRVGLMRESHQRDSMAIHFVLQPVDKRYRYKVTADMVFGMNMKTPYRIDSICLTEGYVRDPMRFLDYDVIEVPIDRTLYARRGKAEFSKDHEKLYLNFVQGEATLDPADTANVAQLEKLKQNMGRYMSADAGITGAVIHGSASPEGGIAFNERLCRRRAEFLRQELGTFPALQEARRSGDPSDKPNFPIAHVHDMRTSRLRPRTGAPQSKPHCREGDGKKQGNAHIGSHAQEKLFGNRGRGQRSSNGIVCPVRGRKERGCLNGVAQKRYRHPRPSQKRGHHAPKITQGIEPFLTKSQLREHEGERERNKGKGEHHAECERNLHCARTVGKRPARDDSHRAREHPDAQHERQACYEHSGAQAPRARGRHEHAPANILLAHLGEPAAHADHNGAHDGVRAKT